MCLLRKEQEYFLADLIDFYDMFNGNLADFTFMNLNFRDNNLRNLQIYFSSSLQSRRCRVSCKVGLVNFKKFRFLILNFRLLVLPFRVRNFRFRVLVSS